MRESKTLKKIREGRVARCTNLGSCNPPFIAHAARAGYDCIWLDLEHRSLELRELQVLMAHFRLYDIDCLLRAPTLGKTQLYRYLEEGATGLMIPHVSTAEKARALVEAVKFPPIGDRGLDNAGFDSGYRETEDALEYIEWANRETFLAVQIETPEAVENVEEIASVPGVDMLFVGPGDLGLRYRLLGDESGERLEAAFERVSKVSRESGVPWACPAGSVDEVKLRRRQGASLIANAGEFMILREGLAQASQQFEGLD